MGLAKLLQGNTNPNHSNYRLYHNQTLHICLEISQIWRIILWEFAPRFAISYDVCSVFFWDSWNVCVHFGPCPHLTTSSLENKYPNESQCNVEVQITSNCPKDQIVRLVIKGGDPSTCLPLISFLRTTYPSHKSRVQEVTNGDNVFHLNYNTLRTPNYHLRAMIAHVNIVCEPSSSSQPLKFFLSWCFNLHIWQLRSWTMKSSLANLKHVVGCSTHPGIAAIYIMGKTWEWSWNFRSPKGLFWSLHCPLSCFKWFCGEGGKRDSITAKLRGPWQRIRVLVLIFFWLNSTIVKRK